MFVMAAIVALTGASGFLGRTFTKHLLASGWQVRALVRRPAPDLEDMGAILVAGAMVSGAGAAGMLVSGAMLGDGKRKLRKLQQAHYRKPRRVQWDLARSRLVF